MIETGTWVYRDGELVPKHLASRLPRGPRSRLSAPMISSDTHEPFQSMADGKMYDSKSAYRASLKLHGMREIGNDIASHVKEVIAEKRPKPAARGDIIKALRKVRAGYKPRIKEGGEDD